LLYARPHQTCLQDRQTLSCEFDHLPRIPAPAASLPAIWSS
jgi:hypothetical protein